jgi:hypothetical protein
MPIQPFFQRARSCETLHDESIDVVTCTPFSATFVRGSSCPMVSKRAEYNRDVGRTTELELEATQHHRPKETFDFKFEKVMYPRQMHSTKAPRYKHRRPTGNRNSFPADFSAPSQNFERLPCLHLLCSDLTKQNPPSRALSSECDDPETSSAWMRQVCSVSPMTSVPKFGITVSTDAIPCGHRPDMLLSVCTSLPGNARYRFIVPGAVSPQSQSH